jgi:hypothetical protein
MGRQKTILALALLTALNGAAIAAPESTKPAAKPASSKASASAAKPAAPTKSSANTIAPTVPAGAIKQTGQGEMDVTIKGETKDKLVVGKLDPPAAFNLEDIQNFPEDRLQPLLNAPVTFREGRDFSSMMDFKEDQPIHPWLPQIAKAPFLQMKSPQLDKPARDWTFAIIDQAGATVSKQDGKSAPPANLTWNGEDTKRGRVAVDTVYIPQLSTVDKEGYHHTYMGQPIQFSSLEYAENGKTTIELSSKRLFLDRKAEFTKEGPLLLDKVCDVIREGSHLPFAIQPYDDDGDLAQKRQESLANYFKTKLFIPENQIVLSSTQQPGQRGSAIAIISTNVPGASQ